MVEPNKTATRPSSLTMDDGDLSQVAAPPEVALGSNIARYIVLEQIGAGGMGVVYSAYDPELDRKVAIKLLVADGEHEATSLGRARLLREAQALARLTHPNVVAVHDVGTWAQRVFVAMEFIHGATLGRWLTERRPTPVEIVEVFLQAGAGLRAAHDAGLLHRDFKPDNVMIGDDRRVRVLDFGLARASGRAPVEIEPTTPIALDLTDRSSRVDTRITRTGAMAGTPAYMAPEQHRGEDLDPRADQFSFCVALWESLCGERPFAGADRISIGLAVSAGLRRPMPPGVSMSTRWRRALERGLAADRNDRFADMASLLAEFAPRRSRVGALLGGGALIVAAASFAMASPPAAAPSCAGAGANMTEIWGERASVSIAEAFANAHPTLGPATATRVNAALDRYAQAWIAASQESCAATHERHEQSDALLDRRTACLGDRLQSMRLLVETLRSADTEVVTRAVDATAALPGVERCADTEVLLSAMPPPEDPQQAAQVQAIRHDIAAAELAGRVGRYAATYANIGAVVEHARRTEHRPILAEAALLAGELASAAGHDEDAVRYLNEAVLAAIASGHDRVHVRGATRLASVVGIGQSRYDEGLAWASHAGAALEHVGFGGPEHVQTSEMMCELLADKGDVAIAFAHCLRTLELAEALWGADDPRMARAHEAVGIAHFAGGRYAEAEQEFLTVDRIVRRDKGDDHPDLIQTANALAGTCAYLRGPQQCVGAFEKAVEAAERGLGRDHDTVADITNNLAHVLTEVGRFDEAELRARRSIEIRQRHPDEHPGLAAALGVIGLVEASRGNTEAANRAFEDSVDIYRRTRGQLHPNVMSALRSAAKHRASQGDRDTARTQLTEALAIAIALHRPETELADVRSELAAVTP